VTWLRAAVRGHALLFGRSGRLVEDVLGDVGQIDGLPVEDRLFAVGQGEQTAMSFRPFPSPAWPSP
jgi:hypothetical protein